MDTKLKNITNFMVILLTAIFLVIDIVYIYFVFIKGLEKDVISGSFVSAQVDQTTGQEHSMLEINYYKNGNNSEKSLEVIECKINCHSESSYQTILPRGFQLCIIKDKNGNELDRKMYYYQSDHSISFKSAREFNSETLYPIMINDKKFALKLDGTYIGTKTVTDGWGVAGMIIGFPFTAIYSAVSGDNFTKKEISETFTYTYEDFLLYCRDLVVSQSGGYGDITISAVDLGGFFSLYELIDGNYESVIEDAKSSQINNYLSCKIHYDYLGMSYAKQSIFGIVADDSQFNSNPDSVTNFWKIAVNYKLTNNNYILRETADGYYLSLSEITLKDLNNYSCDFVYDITIDLDTFEENLIGLDINAFNGIKIKNLQLLSSRYRDFEFKKNSLLNTDIQNFTCSETINLIIDENAYNGGDLL